MSAYTEDNNPIYIYTNEAVPWGVGTTINLLNYINGPGVVESIQYQENGRNFNVTFNVDIDGNGIQSVNAPAFFGFSLDPNSTTQYSPNPTWLNTAIVGGINNKNYICSNGRYWGCTKRIFIPFTRSIVISVSSPNTACILNSQVIYRKWPTIFPLYYSIGERRKYWKILQNGLWNNPIILNAFQSFSMATLQGRGQIEFITHVLWGISPTVSGDPNCNVQTALEGGYTMTIDGNTQTYGTSDAFWGGNYYWDTGVCVVNGPDCGLFTWMGVTWQGLFNMHAYKFCYDKPLFFNQSFQLSWTYGNPTRSQFGQGVTSSNSLFIISYWLENQ